LLLKADKFSLAELFAALSKAQAVDRHLKGGRLSPALVLEDLLLSICRP
jgi:DNA polymerase III delta subunit